MRKTKDVTIDIEGRDKGKMFRITEMSAVQAEKWATRATLELLPRLSQQVSEEALESIKANPGMLTLERLGLILRGVSFPETEKLMDEIIDVCVQFMPGPKVVRPIGLAGAEDIEEASTLGYLRQEAMALHTNFILAAGILNLISAASMMSSFAPIPTSDPQSEPSSHPVKRAIKNFRRSTP